MLVKKLGQPVPLSNFICDEKSGSVQPAQTNTPARFSAFNGLVNVYQHGVIDKLLFGSDFPYTSATECIEALYSINQLAQGTNLPLVPREALRGIVERDTLDLLGLA